MAPDLSFRAALGLLAAGLFAACGGNVETPAGGGAGEGGEGGTGGTTSTPSATGGTGNTGTGTGGTGNTAGSTGGTTTIPPEECDGLSHAACVGAFPSCVPVYDDGCCQQCLPGGPCADCTDLFFHHCEAKAPDCQPAGCGFIPDWACKGAEPDCLDPGGSPSPCGQVAGCVPRYCNLNEDCTTDPVCGPVKADMCVALCDSIPPPCPEGTVAEANGGCYTGMCIPLDVCGFAP